MSHQSIGRFPPDNSQVVRQSPDPTEATKPDPRSENDGLQNAERYRTLFDLAPVAVYSCDSWGVIRDYNNRAAELWGRRPQPGDTDERFCGSFKMYRADGTYMPHEQCPMGDVLTGKVPGVHDGEVHIERPDGSRIVVIVNIAPLKNELGEVTGAINCFYDVTERRQAEEASRDRDNERRRMEEALRDSETRLRLANDELESVVQKRTVTLRHLSTKLMRVQDEERRKIARNLHDSLGQYLANVKMNLDTLRQSATTLQAESLAAALESVERSIVETRTLSILLHPPLLDEVGFASAARVFTDEFAKRSGIEVIMDLPDGIERFPELAEIALFRILQESLTNVHRHSGSSRVHIKLTQEKHQLTLTVQDFGSGMPAETFAAFQRKGGNGGVGLTGMRERVNDLRGRFDIASSKEGTVVFVSVPLADDEHDHTAA